MSAVSLNSDFLDAMTRLPGPTQRKVRQFVTKFMADPKSPGINYERIQDCHDKNLRSVRIDQAYRAIILKAPQEEAHVLLWVDHHDDAYDWARRRKLLVNPATGSLQIVVTTEVPAEAAPQIDKGSPDFLSLYRREDLLACGVPEEALPALGLVRGEEDLLTLKGLLPQEAFEALSYLAGGIPISEVVSTYAPPAAEKVDTDDFERALAHPDSQRRFARIRSQEELEEILDAPLEKWRVFLHPSQRRLVEREFRGPAKVLGGPGTGKTVVAMHRAKYLAEHASDADRVLLTTFTSNLAENLEAIMAGFVRQDAADKLDVIHLHSWIFRFLRSLGMSFQVAEESEIDEFWRQAIASTGVTDWTPTFLAREFRDVVLPNEVEDLASYLTVSRRGARGALRRSERNRIWPVIEEYRRVLDLNKKREWLMLVREAREYLNAHPQGRPYSHVVVDEAQDFHPEEWRLLRALVAEGANDLFIVGDAHQRIYGRRVVLSRCGIDTRGRSSTLKLNYRTTHEIRSWATAMYEGRPVDDLDEGSEDLRGYSSLLGGSAPEVHCFKTEAEESEFISRFVRDLAADGGLGRACIVGRTKKFLQSRILPHLDRVGIPYVVLDKKTELNSDALSVATMHRVKGLEFSTVLLAGVESGLMPLKLGDLQDVELPDHEAQERALLFMAATRARERLLVTGLGDTSSLIVRSSSTGSSHEGGNL